jgi:uncharacterized protein (TIGR02099 family)
MGLTLIREPTGQLHLEGVGTFGAGNMAGPVTLDLPSHARLLNTRILWIDRKAGKAPLPITDIAVLLDRVGSGLKLRASLESELGKAVLSARLEGLLTTTDWSGDSYLRVSNLDVADLFAHYLPASYGLNSLRMDLESWSQWVDAAPRHTQGRFQLRDLDLRPRAEDSEPLEVSQADGRFSFRREGGGLRLGVTGLQLGFHDHRWPTGDLGFAMSPGPDGSRRFEFAADYLRIEDVVRILEVRLPWPELKGPLDRLRPSGEVSDLRLTATVDGEQVDWRGRAGFAGVSIEPMDRIPGVSNLSGRLHGQQDHLIAELGSRDAVLDARRLFRDPISLTRLQGRLDLEALDDGWRLSGERLLADSPHIRTESRLRLEQRPGRPLFLDLQSDFRDGDAAFAGRYYPIPVISEKLVAWLDRSIIAGRITGGTALLHGPLDGFAFEDARNGMFRCVFDVEDVTLDYREGWPRIEQLAGRVDFHGNQLDIQAHSGRIYDSRVAEVSARIDSLHPASPIRVSGRIEGPLGNTLRVLREDALRPRFGEIADLLRGSGESRLDLDIVLPLAEEGDYRLDGRLELRDAAVTLPDWDFAVNRISGRLGFTLDGLSAAGIRARILDTPVSVDVATGDDGTTRIRAEGRFGTEAMARRFSGLPVALLTGESDFALGLEVPPRRAAAAAPTTLTLSSELQGIGIALPAPLAKEAVENRPFNVRIPLGDDSATGRLDYGGVVSASFSNDGSRVDVAIGGTEAAARPAPGIRIGGHLAEVDLMAWGQALAALPDRGDRALPLLSAELQIDRLQADNVSIRQLHLTAKRAEGLWQGEVNAANLAGRFAVPERLETAPVQIDLERLNISVPLGSVDAAIPPVPDPASGPDPTGMPELDLTIADLRVNDARLGRMRVDAQRAEEGLRVTELSLHGGQLELDSAGHWSRDPSGFRTQLGGRVSTEDLGDLLVGLGYSRQIEGAGGSVDFLLHWPGSPTQYHRATVQGRVGLDIGSGRLVELDPGVTRVVGLLNLNALTRRLRLDFSDIYKKGYSFDSIRGSFAFARGTAFTSDLSMLGPAGRIDLTGTADLMARALDQKVVVTPNFDATLPIAGTIAGGPVAGIAVLLAQKVMTKQVDNINRFEYSLSGPWEQPEVTQLDTGGTLSKILQPFAGGSPPPEDRDEPLEKGDSAAAGAAASPAVGVDTEPTAARQPGMTTAEAIGQETAPPPPARKTGPLDGLMDLLKKGESHGADLPGSSN